MSPSIMENLLSGWWEGGGNLNVFYNEPYLVAYRWKGLLKREIMTLGRKFQAEIVACKSWPVIYL